MKTELQQQMNRYSLEFPEVGDAWRLGHQWKFLVVGVIEPRWWYPAGSVVLSKEKLPAEVTTRAKWTWDLENYLVVSFQGFEWLIGNPPVLSVGKQQFDQFIPHIRKWDVRAAHWRGWWTSLLKRHAWTTY